MTTTEIDNIDAEIQEVDTTDLSGEAVERLLYQSGFDSQLVFTDEGVAALEIVGDGVRVVMSETWADAGNWYIDPNGIVLDLFVEDNAVTTEFPQVSTEEELVEAIENLVEKNS